MKIAAISNYTLKNTNIQKNNQRKIADYSSNPCNPDTKKIKELPNFAYQPSFKGISFENDIVRSVKGKTYYGDDLYENNFINFDKLGWEELSKSNFDITKATDKEIYAFQHALALGETVDTSWVKRFNDFNVDLPLATSHVLGDRASRKAYAQNLRVLNDTTKNEYLDTPIFDKKGNLTLNCVVWDTETTGTNATNHSLPLDKIIQIGSIQMKNGKIDESTAYKQYINPQMPIPVNSSIVHGIYDKDVKDKPTLDKVLPQYLSKHLNKKNGVIVAYNSKFDMAMLNNSIDDYNKFNTAKRIPNKKTFDVLDPFILTQRIHPYVGAKKKLSEQYKFFFCKNLDDAHDAFADVKGTVDMLKYDLYYLNENREDKNKPLTLRDVLLFQNGSNNTNIDIPLNHLGCNDKVNFKMSYRLKPLNVKNYSNGYKLSEATFPAMEGVIGEENTQKLRDLIIPPALASETDEGLETAETDKKPPVNKRRTIFYNQNRNFKKILKFAGIEGYGDMNRREVIDYITDMSKNYIDEHSIELIFKNANPKDKKLGNDMPDFSISRRVMAEKQNLS